MVSIRPSTLVGKLVANPKIDRYILKPAKENPAKFAARMALVSALTKDAVGCYYYVTQSLNNDRIPEEKRKFVAAIDLMNGILNVGLQFTIGSWLDKKAPIWFENKMNKKINTDRTRDIVKDVSERLKGVQEATIENIENSIRSKELLGKAGKISKALKVGYSAAIMLIATQVVTKRIIVPFLATPLASWYKARFLDKKKPESLPSSRDYQWSSVGYSGSNQNKSAFKNMAMK